MDYIKLNNEFIIISNLAVYSKGFKTIRLYEKPMAKRVKNIKKINGKTTISALLPLHKDNKPVDIPSEYIMDITSSVLYGEFEYNEFIGTEFNTKYKIFEITYEKFNKLYVLVDKWNIMTFYNKESLFNDFKNNLLENLEYIKKT